MKSFANGNGASNFQGPDGTQRDWEQRMVAESREHWWLRV
jgi:hypothetical protein